MFLPEFDRGFDLFRVERDPLSANLHQRRLQLCQRPELGFGQLSFAQRQLPLIIDQALHRHSAFGKGILALLRFHLHFDAQPRTLFVPPRRDENPEARAFEQRRSLAQKGVRAAGIYAQFGGAFPFQALGHGRK